MSFNPKKKFGTLRGKHDKYPTAKYKQDGHYYDRDLNLLSGDKAKPTPKKAPVQTKEPAPPPPSMQDNRDKIFLEEKLRTAQAALNDAPTAANKIAVASIENDLDELMADPS